MLVPRFTGAFVRVVQLVERSEVLNCSRYGLLVNGQVNTSDPGSEKVSFMGGYMSTTETLSSRIPFVMANPLVALMPWNERMTEALVAIQLVLKFT